MTGSLQAAFQAYLCNKAFVVDRVLRVVTSAQHVLGSCRVANDKEAAGWPCTACKACMKKKKMMNTGSGQPTRLTTCATKWQEDHA